MSKVFILYFKCPMCNRVIISESLGQLQWNALQHVKNAHKAEIDVGSMIKMKEIVLD